MLALLFCIMGLTESSAKTLITTEIYSMVSFHSSFRFSDGRWAIFDFRNSFLYLYSASGVLLKTHDGNVQGPESLKGLASLKMIDGKLYGTGSGRLVTFSDELEILENRKTPFERFEPLAGGRFISYQSLYGPSGEIVVRLHDSYDDEGRVLVRFSNEQTVSLEKFVFNPAREYPFFSLSKDNSLALWKEVGSGKVVVYDFKAGRVRSELDFSHLEPKPFPKEWGAERLKKLEERMAGLDANIIADFPEKLPIISMAQFTVDGNVIINLWTHQPWVIEDLRLFSPDGKALDHGFVKSNAHRFFLGKEGEIGWVSSFNEEGDVIILQVPEAKIYEESNRTPGLVDCSFCD